MLEVEIKAAVDDIEALRTRLERLGAVHRMTRREIDRYFNSPAVQFQETDEALRLRCIVVDVDVDDDDVDVDDDAGKSGDDATSKRRYELTYKGAKLDAGSKTRRELTLPLVPDEAVPARTVEMLRQVGFEVFGTVRKRRELYEYKRFELCLDEVDGLGTFIEAETAVPEGEPFVPARDEAIELLGRLAIDETQFIRTSYLELLFERGEIGTNQNG